VELATILGTIQSTLTDFKYLSKEWKDNTEEERLLGVSLTGIMDNELLNGSLADLDDEFMLHHLLQRLRLHARETNEKWAGMLGIPSSAAITCVKPSGTVSQLVNSASGIHARHNKYYIRRIRMDKKDPMYVFLKDKGMVVEDDVRNIESTAVFSFPFESPEGAICRTDRTAIEQLELWLIYQRHWCEHKPSVTVSVKDEEWPDVIAWVWKYFDELSGVSFLPFSDHSYVQAPYEDILDKKNVKVLKKGYQDLPAMLILNIAAEGIDVYDLVDISAEEQYNKMVESLPTTIDFTQMIEDRDVTEGSQTLACTAAGGCEI